MSNKLNYKWLIMGFIPVFVILALFQRPSLWEIPLGSFKYESPIYPFLDMKGRLAAMEAFAFGINIYEHGNPFDPLHRMSTKPSYPLHLGKLGLNLNHAELLGFLTICSFLTITIICLKPNNWIEVTYGIILICSPPILLGIERANDDLVLYSILMPIPLLLASNRRLALTSGIALILLITPVKYYPAAALLILLHSESNLRRLLWAYSISILILATQLYLTLDEILFLQGKMPNPETTFSIGSKLLFTLLGVADENTGIARILSLLITLSVCLFIVFQPYWNPPKISVLRERYCIFGTAIFGFCYYAAGNWDYRILYILPCIPYLWQCTRSRNACKWPSYASWLIIALLPFIFFVERLYLDIALNKPTIEEVRIAVRGVATLKQIAVWVAFTSLALISSLILKPNIHKLIASAVALKKHDQAQPTDKLPQSN